MATRKRTAAAAAKRAARGKKKRSTVPGFTMPKRATGDGAVGLKRIGVAADPDSPAGRARAGTPLDPEHPYFVLECTTHGKEQRVICSDFNLIRMFAMIAMELGVKLPRSVAERIVMLDGAGPMTFSYAEPETLGDRVAMNLARASMEAEMSKRAAAAGLVMARVEPTGLQRGLQDAREGRTGPLSLDELDAIHGASAGESAKPVKAPTDGRRNGGAACDVFSGPCACGAWHDERSCVNCGHGESVHQPGFGCTRGNEFVCSCPKFEPARPGNK